MADVNNSRLIQLDHYIPSDWYTLITDPNRADHASNVFFHILPKKGKLNDTYQKLKTVPHLYTYLKEEIPEEFHYRHNRHVMPIFILSRKKDGPLQKTSWELTVVVTMATVTNSLTCTPFFLPKDLHSKKVLFQSHLKMWIYTLLCVIFWALNQRQTMAHYKQCSIC